MIAAFSGIAGGLLTIAFARWIKGERWLYSLGLMTLPGFYAIFALYAGDHSASLKELLFGVPYLLVGLICAFVGIRRSAVLVGVLWLLHAGYDAIHGQLLANPGVPQWYPLFCAAIDVVVGTYLLWLSRRLR